MFGKKRNSCSIRLLIREIVPLAINSMSQLPKTVKSLSGTQSCPSSLKVGIVLDTSQVPGWIYHLIEKLTSCSTIETVVFVLKHEETMTARHDDSPVLFRSW